MMDEQGYKRNQRKDSETESTTPEPTMDRALAALEPYYPAPYVPSEAQPTRLALGEP